MNKLIYLLLGVVLSFSACTPKITTSLQIHYPPLYDNEKVTVLEMNDSIPKYAEVLGTVKVGDTGFTMKCDYNTVLEAAKIEVKKAGGNALKIAKHDLPGFVSSCHQISATVLRLNKLADLGQVNSWSEPFVPKKPYSHFRLALNGGYSYNIGKKVEGLDAYIQDYYDELRSCGLLGVDASYFFSVHSGIGLNYSVIQTKNSLENVSLTENGVVTANGTLSDDEKVSYFGPMYTTRLMLDKNNHKTLFFNVGLGYMQYNNTEKLANLKYDLSGSTFGLSYSLGYDHAISSNLALGIQLSLITGTLWEINRFDGVSRSTITLDKTNCQSLSRIEVLIGMRFNTK